MLARVSVVDTKYYVNTLQRFYSSETIHSANLYQLFAYLKNLGSHEAGQREVEGVLLYPTVSQSLELEYVIQGHRVRVVTLDLNADWQQIRQRLLGILRPGPAGDRANGASAGATDISSARGG